MPSHWLQVLKGLFTKKYYSSNLILWIVMKCGIADLGQRGVYKLPKLFGHRFCPQGLRMAPQQQHQGPRIVAPLSTSVLYFNRSCHSRYSGAIRLSMGTKSRTKIFQFYTINVIDPSDENQLYQHPIAIQNMKFKRWKFLW